jgi:hypothetical protein
MDVETRHDGLCSHIEKTSEASASTLSLTVLFESRSTLDRLMALTRGRQHNGRGVGGKEQ